MPISLVDNKADNQVVMPVMVKRARWQDLRSEYRRGAQMAIRYLTVPPVTHYTSCFLALLSQVRAYKPLRDHSLCILTEISFSHLSRFSFPSLFHNIIIFPRGESLTTSNKSHSRDKHSPALNSTLRLRIFINNPSMRRCPVLFSPTLYPPHPTVSSSFPLSELTPPL